MSILTSTPEDVVAGAASIPLDQFFNLAPTTASGTQPACIVVCALDRNEYTAASTGQTGDFSGDGAQLSLTPDGGDGRGASIIFTYSASTHAYTNATYGNLAQLDYTSSASPDDVTNISLWSASSLAAAQAYSSSAFSLIGSDPSGYLGSAVVVTDPSTPSTPAAATPNGIAAAAAQFVGKAWNMDGCWLLANAISAEAGAALPVQSTIVGQPGLANGEWIVAYNGPVSANANWVSLVKAGDVITFANPGGASGHVTTCVSGSGSTAQLIDNITYESPNGSITNSAHDGSAADILISAAHPASWEFTGVAAKSVVIYQLDTPVVAVPSTSVTASLGTNYPLSTFVHATDPAGHAITSYQVYDSLAGATFAVAGATAASVAVTAQSASTALTLTSLSSVTLDYSQPGTDTLEVRAFNGTYWGDWQAITVNAVGSPPKLTTATPNQVWQQGAHISLALPATAFTDPQHQALTYTATGANGAALPSWLTFNATTKTFSGTVPNAPATLTIVVTATDTLGLHSSETFAASTPALAPVLAQQTPAQSWLIGGAVMDSLPVGTFTDPQHEALTYRATLSTGAALPTWLSFNATTETFSGTAPSNATSLSLRVTATDTSNLSASELFGVTFSHGAAGFSMVESAPAQHFGAWLETWSSNDVMMLHHH